MAYTPFEIIVWLAGVVLSYHINKTFFNQLEGTTF